MKFKDINSINTKASGRFVRINTLLHERHSHLIEALSQKKRGIDRKTVIYTALENYFNPLEEAEISKRLEYDLKVVKKDIHKLLNTQQIFLDAFTAFVKIWLCHTREVPEDEREVALISMEHRFKKFTKLIMDEMTKGGEIHKILSDMMAETR